MMVAVGSALNVDIIQRRFPMSRTMLRPNISAHLDSRVRYVTNNVLQGTLWWSTNLDFTSKNNSSHTCSQTWTSESSSWCQEVQMVCGSVTGASILRRRGRAWLITLKVDMLRAGALLAIFAQKSVPLVMQCRCMSWDSIRFSTKCDSICYTRVKLFGSLNKLFYFRFFWRPWCNDRCPNKQNWATNLPVYGMPF